MKKAAVITTPFPTPEQVARSLGVTARRLKQLRKLVEAEREPTNGSIHNEARAGRMTDARSAG